MPYPNWHAARIASSDDFLRIRVLQELPNGIMIYGGPLKTDPRGPGKPQSYRFPKDKFTVAEAKAWLKEHDITFTLFEPATEQQKQMDKETFTTDKDIFSVGTWNGDKYTHSDLENMVENFDMLNEADNFRVPFKIDLFKDAKPKKERHGGQPAVGWITSLKKVGNKLIAHIENIPKVIKELIDNKAYKQVSSEVLFNVKHKGKILKRVLSGVALLGIELPAVENLNEFGELYDLELDDVEFLKTYIVEGMPESGKNKKEEEEMELKEMQKKVEDLQSKISHYEKDAETNSEVIKVLKAEKEETEKKYKEIEKASQELTSKKKAEEIENFIKKQKEEGRILPAHESMIQLVMENLEDVKTVKFAKEDKIVDISVLKIFENYIESLPKIIDFKVKSQKGDNKEVKEFQAKPVEEAGSEKEQKLDFLTQKYMKEHEGEKIDYQTALLEISKEHPELCDADKA